MELQTERDASACDHCHACRKRCAFLDAYGIDVGDVERFRALAYHCFLCGACARVCPHGIDGRRIALEERRRRTKAHGDALDERGFGLLLAEKSPYAFANYRNATPESVLFPGCSFTARYPRATRVLAQTLHEVAGMGTVYDCCGKPVFELGLEDRSQRDAHALANRLEARGVTELVTVCPNCQAHLAPRLPIPVTNVYDKLADLELGRVVSTVQEVFPPCPDREHRTWFDSLQRFMEGEVRLMDAPTCCGLGGCAFVKEPSLARGMAQEVAQRTKGTVHTYCASCTGALRKGGTDAVHILPAILGVDEQPAGAKSLFNRALAKFR